MENKKDIEIIETSESVIIEEEKKAKKPKKNKMIKNQAIFKKGGYSLAITALVLAGLIIFNWLCSSLADRFHLEVDMTVGNKNSLSSENIDFIKNIDSDVSVIVCSSEEDYSGYMEYFAQSYYSVTTDASTSEYFDQTVKLISKYTEYNDRIKVEYVDPQSTRFAAIDSTYGNYDLQYGDIIVSSMVNNNERIKVLRFADVYYLEEDSNSSYYGYPTYTLKTNMIENALSGAISYVTSDETKKVAVISGHSKDDFTQNYLSLLQLYNYSIIDIADPVVSSISNECDAIIISAPTTDFVEEEISVIADFLDNGGKKGKGLIFFAAPTNPSLPNFYSFLKQWGIEVKEGVVFETDSSYHIADSPSAIISFPAEIEGEEITSNLDAVSITGSNAPMKVCDAASYEREAVALMQTSNSSVIAPIGSDEDWADYKKEDKQIFDCVIQAKEEDIDPATNESITSYVMAFSSVEFIESNFALAGDFSNRDIVIACSDRACHIGSTTLDRYVSKIIENDYFTPTGTAQKAIATIFVFIVPILMIAWGIVVFIRRRNAR